MMETLTIRQEKILVIDDAGDGRGFLTEEKKSVELLAVKEDPVIDLLDDDYGFGNCSLPKPMEGLHETGPPPFLKKTFRMVEDPETDKIISWTDSQKSFVVWDHHQLSRSLLPKHFKHNNFSSFIRQLNTYGFKKIDSDRWEFANEGFQGGKEHLLKNIKRRKHNSQNLLQQRAIMRPLPDSAQSGSEIDLEKLRSDGNKIKMEILQLKQQQESTDNHLAMVMDRIKTTESKHQQMFVFLAKAFASPVFYSQFLQLLRQKKELCNGQIAKKLRLEALKSNDNSVGDQNENERSQNQEELATIESDVKTHFCASVDDEGSPSTEKGNGNATPESVSKDWNTEGFIMWEKLLDDELIFEDEAGFGQDQSKIVFELENLIKSPDWIGEVGGLEEQASVLY